MSVPAADALIDEILGANPRHTPGTRPIHAPGICATGWFQATRVASTYTSAPHFGGARVPVTARFSNGTGDLDTPDDAPHLVRGLAVKFHLGEGTPESRDVDMVAMTLPVFFVKTPDRFPDFVAAASPAPVKPRSLGQKICDLLTLRLTPDPAGAGLFEFARQYPAAAPAVATVGSLLVPESYATASYNTVHAFTITADSGATRSVRFRWEPVEGVRPALPGTTNANFLQAELRARIERQGVEFVLRMQVADQGDDTADSTRAWPQRRCRVVMGHLRLAAVSADQLDGCQGLSFDPCRLAPGIAPSDDPILATRGPVYERSWVRRTS